MTDHQPSTAPARIPAIMSGGWASQTEQQNFQGPPAGDPRGGEATPPATTGTPTQAAPAATGDQTPAATPPATPPQFTPEQTQERIRQVNEEARTYREERDAANQRAEQAEARSNAILAAAGFQPNGQATPPSVDQLQEQLSARDAAAVQLARENAVIRIGTRPDITANVDRLLDSSSFVTALRAIPPTDTAAIETLIRERVTSDASLRAVIPAAASGSSTPTGATPSPNSRKSRADALAERLNPAKS